MAKLRKFGNEVDDPGVYCFQCPGCGHEHEVWTSKPNVNGAAWKWNGNMDLPSFEPSVLIKWRKNANPNWEEPEDAERTGSWSGQCHSWITDGKIRFFDDSTHHLKGQIVDIPEYENNSDAN